MAFRGRHPRDTDRRSRRIAGRLAVTVLLAASLGLTATAACAAVAEPDVVETTLSIAADPGVPASVVIHAEMIGAYVDAGGAIPAGTWSFLVADDSGAALFMKDVPRPAGSPTSVDVVWSDVPAGVAASGIVSYVPDVPSDQLEFAGATTALKADGTSADETDVSRTVEAPTPTKSSKPAGQPADPVSIALGVLVAACLMVAGVGILLLVRESRRSAGDRA